MPDLLSEPEALKPMHVAVAAPPFPLELASVSFLSALVAAEEEAKALKVSDEATARQAAILQQRLTTAGRKLEETRTQLKAPFLDIGRRIDETAKAPQARIQKAKDLVASQLVTYFEEQKRLAAEAEAKRLAELKRLEEQRQKEEEEARRQAAAIAAKAAPVLPGEDIGFDDMPTPPKTETEQRIEAVKYAPPVPVSRPVGIAMRSRLVAKVVAPDKVPETFIVRTVNESAIRATFCTPWKEGAELPICPGVAFEIEKTAVSTGR